MTDKKFKGTDTYVATDDLNMAVNAAVTLERPILIKGEPGTGKTQLAFEIAGALGAAVVRMAHQVNDQGATGIVRLRRGRSTA